MLKHGDPCQKGLNLGGIILDANLYINVISQGGVSMCICIMHQCTKLVIERYLSLLPCSLLLSSY